MTCEFYLKKAIVFCCFFFKKALDSSAQNYGMVWGESGAGKVMMNQVNRGLPWCQ